MLYDEILLAVGELLIEKGYAAMSMDELAARVGVSKPTLYSHFPTKDDLLVAAMMHGIDRVSTAIQADTTPRSPLQQLVFILRIVLQMQVDKGALTPRPWSPEILQVLCSREEVVEQLRSHESVILALVREGIDGGEIDAALDPVLVVRAFYAAVNTLHFPFMSQMNPADPAAVAETLVTIFERGVRAPAV
jgi:AcrR family transcriptional regulator